MATRTLNEIDRALKRLESLFERGFTAAPSPIPGATPEMLALGADGLPLAETGQVLGPPGYTAFMPPGCNILIARVKHGQDPVILSGTGSPAQIKAISALVATPALMPLCAAGAVLITDIVAGTGGILIHPAGILVLGTLSVFVGGAITPMTVP